MLELELHRRVPADAATTWTLLAEPEAMNLWSTAHVQSIATGDGGHPAGVGALRQIELPRRAGRLTEVIEQSDAPHRLQYRVISGAPVVRHQGTITLTPIDPHTTDLRWRVEIVAVTRVLEPVMRALLVGELERSLDRLVEVAPTARAGSPPPVRTIDATVDLAALRRNAVAIAAHQRDFADELERAGDPRGHFARVYHYVTESLIAAVDAGRFEHPAWVLRLIPVFDPYFTNNILAAPGAVEPHWQRAFSHIAKAVRRGANRFELIMHAVYAGMRAHIEEDLPRTLAKVYVEHYAGACDHARFRADYLRMKHVFTEAGDRLMADIPRSEWSPRARIIDRLTPHALRETLIDRYMYPITRERARAFARGGLMAAMLLER